MMKKIPLFCKNLLWLFCFLLTSTAFAQSIQLTGKITDEKGEGLPSASVVEDGTTNGTVTDLDGKFSLNVSSKNTVLVVSFVGYETQKITVGNQTSIAVTLSTGKALDEVVVVGYGSVKKSDLTGSVSSIKGDELKQTPVANFVQGLQARASGVQVIQNSGAPGGSISVRVRGNNSISGSSEPLYVIDGFPVAGSDNPIAGGGSGIGTENGNRLSVLSTLNPNDIESMEVLKDASATAIYGTRGANGVVLITTKRGKAGKTRVTYEGYYGTQKINKMLELMNAEQYALYENELTASNINPDPKSLGVGTDWQSLVFRQAPIQNHQLSISGGNEKTQYNVSLNHFNQDGIIITSNFNRSSVRMNLDNIVNKNLKIGTNITYNYAINNGAATASANDGGAGIVVTALQASPYLAPFGPDGRTAIYEGRFADVINPLSLAYSVKSQNTTRRFLGNIFADWTILRGLSYKATFGGDLINDARDSYADKYLRSAAIVNGIAGKGSVYSNTFLHESQLNYQKTLGAHDLTFTGVFSTQTQTLKSDAITASQFPNDLVFNNNLSQAAVVTVASNKQSWRLDSYTGRINYNFKSKYLLTLTGRMDGSSRFGENNKYGFFPSVAAAWRIGEESFMKNQNFISDLKLRVSYGVTGNADIPLYNSLARLNSVGNYNFNNQRTIGIASANIANPDLKWEKSAQADIGIDFGIFDNRVRVTADVYQKKTKDLLLSRSVPISSGFASVFGNFGAVENKGMELSINVNVLNSAIKWDINGNFSANRNQLTLIDGVRTQILPADGNGTVAAFSNTSILRIGAPIGSFYGYSFDGIYQTGDNIPTGRTAGNIRYRDLNGDGVLSAADQDIIGNPNPNYIFGLNNTIKYKNFDLSLFIQGVQGNDIFNAARLRTEGGAGPNQYATMLNRWTPTNPSNRYQKASTGQRINQSDIHIEDGSFIRFKNLTIGYTLPAIGKNALLANSRIYVSANNFITITNYTGYDPEVNTVGQNNLNLGVDNIGYPIPRSILVGVQLNF
jgi:TonB-linked SusC/RagA family outer membrane protein